MNIETSADATGRFWCKVAIVADNDCWIWTGARAGNGYGMFYVRGRRYGAHRVAYLLANGEIPTGSLICHRCNTPLCCNPAHLYAGSVSDNTRDRVESGHSNALAICGEKNTQARLTVSQVKEIRSLHGVIGQRKLAARFGVSQRTIGRIHRGERWALALAIGGGS